MTRNRQIALGVAVLGLTVLGIRHPTADFRLITHDVHDPSPRQMRAAVDLGLVGVSVLYTWTVDRLR
jgi:hypothetical protein